MLSASSHHLKKASLVCYTASLFFFYEFIQLNMFNAISQPLMREFNITAVYLGHLSAYYFYADTLFLFPAGIILDRVSTRKAILAAMSISVISTVIFACATHIWIAEICRFATGIGASFCFLSCMRLVSRWFPPRHMAMVIGLIVTIAMLGGMVAQTPLTLLTDHLGWRQALLIDAVLGVMILIAIFCIVKDYPDDMHAVILQQRTSLANQGFWSTLKKAIINSQNWLAGIYTSLLNLPIFLLGAMWGSLYLVQVHHLTRPQSTNVTAAIFVGTIIGSPLIGWFSDRLARRKAPMMACAILSLLTILAIMYIPHITQLSGILLFLLLGFFSSGQIVSYPLISESNPPALTGTATGLASTLIMAGGMLQPVFGWLMDMRWNHAMSNGIPLYALNNYRLALAIIPIACIIGLLVTIPLRETRGVQTAAILPFAAASSRHSLGQAVGRRLPGRRGKGWRWGS